MEHYITFVFLMKDGTVKKTKTTCSYEMYEIYYDIFEMEGPESWNGTTRDYVAINGIDESLSNMESYYNDCVYFTVEVSDNITPYRWLDDQLKDCSKYHLNVNSGKEPRDDFHWLVWFITTGYENLSIVIENGADWKQIDIGLIDLDWCLSDEIVGIDELEYITEEQAKSSKYAKVAQYSQYHNQWYA